MKRNATAVWNGTGKEGSGHLSTQSTVLNKTQYSFNSRFAEGVGTNPEELVAAAHAGCFTMKLTFILNAAGFTPDEIETKCTITLDNGVITNSHLEVKGTVPGVSQEQFTASVTEAKENCLISKLYNTNITVESTLA
ncbi:MAG: OsmC family protein [Chitinophagaceae bacterium]|nr:OsmC family protein [Chitinophagaceae bacterium]MBL0055015.1 OsmC family protein [Chitinophagaceae bacterium]